MEEDKPYKIVVFDPNSIVITKPPPRRKEGVFKQRIPHSNSLWTEFKEWERTSPYTEPPVRVVLSREVINAVYEPNHHRRRRSNTRDPNPDTVPIVNLAVVKTPKE